MAPARSYTLTAAPAEAEHHEGSVHTVPASVNGASQVPGYLGLGAGVLGLLTGGIALSRTRKSAGTKLVATDSPSQRRSSAPRAIRRSLAVALALGIALLLPVSPALAHDVLTGTTPGNGQTVKVLPDAVKLTFSNMPIAIGTTVNIEDTAENNWAVGDVKIVDNVLSQPLLPGTPSGNYTVN